MKILVVNQTGTSLNRGSCGIASCGSNCPVLDCIIKFK